MAIYTVSYDLRKPGRNYNDLYRALRQYTHCHMLESYWYIDTAESASTVRTALGQHIDSNDQLIVHRVRKNWSAHKKCRCTTWLKDASRRW